MLIGRNAKIDQDGHVQEHPCYFLSITWNGSTAVLPRTLKTDVRPFLTQSNLYQAIVYELEAVKGACM